MFGLETIASVIGIIGGLAGSLSVFYMLKANKRKVDAESEKSTTEAYEKMVNSYEKRIDKLLIRVEDLEKRVGALESEIDKRDIIILAQKLEIEQLSKFPKDK